MNKIKQLRIKFGKTQVQVANALGISQQLLCKYEHGSQIPNEVLVKFSKYFHVSIDYLLDNNIKDDKTEFVIVNNIKFLRKKFGVTQKQLSSELGIDQSTISKWELNKVLPDIKTLIKIAEYFNVSLDSLVDKNIVEEQVLEEDINHCINAPLVDLHKNISGLSVNNLKIARKNMKYTQEDLADKLGVAKNTISQWERGTREPSIDTLKKLSEILDASIDYLLDNGSVKQGITNSSLEQLIISVAGLNESQCERVQGYIDCLKQDNS